MAFKYIVVTEHLTPLQQLRRALHLAKELTWAELRGRQFQRLLGPAWWILEPSLMTVAFFFLTSRIGYSTGPKHFLFIFIGTTVWRFFSRCLDTSVITYLSAAYVLRQVSFPLIATNLSTLATEFVFFLCGLGALFFFGLVLGDLEIGWSYLALPLVIFVQVLTTLGPMIILSSIGVYVRDIGAPLSIGLAVAFFVSPGIHNITTLPKQLEFLGIVNPFYTLFPAYRSILLDDKVPPLLPLAGWGLVGVLLILLGYGMYSVVRPHVLRLL